MSITPVSRQYSLLSTHELFSLRQEQETESDATTLFSIRGVEMLRHERKVSRETPFLLSWNLLPLLVLLMA